MLAPAGSGDDAGPLRDGEGRPKQDEGREQDQFGGDFPGHRIAPDKVRAFAENRCFGVGDVVVV